MLVLGIETSAGSGSVALAQGGEVLEAVELPREWKSTTLHGEIAGLLGRHQTRPQDVEGYAVTSGPGAFTAVRIGLAAVKGLAEAHRKPVVAVSTLELAAIVGARRHLRDGALMAPVLEAGRGQVFWAVCRVREDEAEAVVEDSVGPLRELVERVRGLGLTGIVFCGFEAERYLSGVRELGWGGTEVVNLPSELATELARLGTKRLEAGLGEEAARVDGHYVRPSDAELFWKE